MKFVCKDDDISQEIYVMVVPSDEAAICKGMDEAVQPGEARLKNISRSSGAEDCVEKQGWLRFLIENENRKSHLFIGSKGKATCAKLENEIVESQMKAGDVNLWLRKRLVCN